jgi:hypothetical protein
MGGKPFKVSRLAHNLRLRLWRSFLGLSPKDESIKDPGNFHNFTRHLTTLASEYVYKNIWRRTAKVNTWIFKKVFQILPDTVRTLVDFKLLGDPQHIDMLREVKGYLVEFPHQFLIDEQMSPGIFDKAVVLPTAVFV